MERQKKAIDKLSRVRKTNLGELDVLMIQNKEKPNICPNFYGHDITEENSNLAQMGRFYDIKDNIHFRLINAEKNQKLLEEIPHVFFLNLAM